MLDEAITQAASNFTKEARAALRQAEIVFDEMAAVERQLADRLAADLLTSYSVIGADTCPPLLKQQFAVPEWLRSAAHIERDWLHSAMGNIDPTARELAELTARELGELDLAERRAIELAEHVPPFGASLQLPQDPAPDLGWLRPPTM